MSLEAFRRLFIMGVRQGVVCPQSEGADRGAVSGKDAQHMDLRTDSRGRATPWPSYHVGIKVDYHSRRKSDISPRAASGLVRGAVR